MQHSEVSLAALPCMLAFSPVEIKNWKLEIQRYWHAVNLITCLLP